MESPTEVGTKRGATYSGRRSHAGAVVMRNRVRMSMDPAMDWAPEHALGTSGPEWGYRGRGPKKLAFALLFDYTGDKQLEMPLVYAFMDEVISQFRDDVWTLESQEISSWLQGRQP